jgi:hypothetical protein
MEASGRLGQEKRMFMDTLRISELMIPVDLFPRISSQANFYEAILALEAAQKSCRNGKCRECVVLVEDQNGNITGKLSPVDAIRGLEPKYDKIDTLRDNIRFGLPQVFETMKDDYRLWQEPLSDLCRKAVNIKVESMVCLPGKGESIKITDSMDEALHLFATSRHHYLLVLEDEQIRGLLLLSDVYAAIFKIVKACGIK